MILTGRLSRYGGLNNCDLSDIEARDLDPIRHLVIDRDADIYERNIAARHCRETSLTTWNTLPTRPIKTNTR